MHSQVYIPVYLFVINNLKSGGYSPAYHGQFFLFG